MKVLIAFSCALVVVAAQYGHYPGQQQLLPQHLPVIKDGVPTETPEVQHAKAAHYAAINQVVNSPYYQHQERPENQEAYENGQYQQPQPSFRAYQQPAPAYSQPSYNPAPAPAYNPAPQYNPGPSYNPGPAYNSAPAYNPAAYNSAPTYTSSPTPYSHGPARQVVPAYQTTNVLPGVAADGKPLDTPEVEAAKAHHFALVNEALSRNIPRQPQPHY